MSTGAVDLVDLEFWSRPLEARADTFRSLRAQTDLLFCEEPEPPAGIPKGPGFWSLTRHAEVLEASRHPELFRSGNGVNITDMPQPLVEFFGSMIAMDDPRHARLRRIVSRGFTPKFLETLRADVEGIAEEMIRDIAPRGEGDFVTDVAALLPLRVIVDLMGIPRSEEKFIFDRTNIILGFTDPEYVGFDDPNAVIPALLTAATELAGLVQELAEDRLREPRSDLTTALVTAEVDGEKLSPQELASFFILLVAAGNETTRNAISHGMDLLTRHPDQRAKWQSDFEAMAPTAVEEIIRVASPVIHFRRTVATDGARIGDHTFSEGEKVILWYWSANRDETVFERPEEFDVTRHPNDHVGFGGPGPHYCLGAHLARREITVVFRELFKLLPDIEASGEPDRLLSGFINGIKHMPARWTPQPAIG